MRTAITVIALVLGTGASRSQDEKGPPATPDPKVPWSEAVEGLQCRLEADKAAWKVDEVPTFRLHVRNLGKRDLNIHMSQAACKIEFDGVWYEWIGPVSILSGPWPAGKQYDDFEVRVSLDSPWAKDNKSIALTPGKHKVRVAYVTLDVKNPVRVVSNAVEIQIGAGEPTPRKDTDQEVRELKEEVKALRQQLEKLEKRLAEVEKGKPK